MSETAEFYQLLTKNSTDRDKNEREIDKIRKNKKLHFWMNSGMTKFSTIHSYKGWEINTLFLIVQQDAFESTYRELIYTGFTRCMSHLVIINVGDEEFDQYVNTLQIVNIVAP